MDSWISPTNDNHISFVDVNPGEYVLEVSGSKGNGIWSRNRASVRITILPPVWKTIWFRFLLLSTFVVAVILSIRATIVGRYRRKLRKLVVEQKIREERERISDDLHDNIGASLSSLVTGLEITQKHFENLDTRRVKKSIESLETHTRKTIDHLRQAIWSLQDNVKTCGELVEKIREFLRGQIFSKDQPQPRVTCALDETISLTPFNSLNLYRIIQEALYNAIKYSNAKTINIDFTITKKRQLTIVVADDGSGFDYDKLIVAGKSFGLQNMKRRADKIGAGLKINSRSGLGTKVVIDLTI